MASSNTIDVNYESLVSFDTPEGIDADERSCLVILRVHGLEKFLTFKPAFLLEEAVIEFFRNLRRCPQTGALLSTVTAVAAGGHSMSLDIDVQSVAQDLFELPNTGLSPLSFKPSAVEAIMAAHVNTQKITGTLLMVNFILKAKPLIRVMKHALLGMLGSHHQVSGPKQKVLAALLSDDTQWNWEDVFLNALTEISNHSKLCLGVKVSALILHAVRGRNVTWSRSGPVYTSWIRFGITKPQGAAAGTKKKRSQIHRSTSSSRGESAGQSQTLLRDSRELEQGSETLWRVIPEDEKIESPPVEETEDTTTTPPAEQEPAWRDIPDEGDELATAPPSSSGIPPSTSPPLYHDADLTSASLPPPPSTDILTAELTSAAKNIESPSAQPPSAEEQNPEVQYVGL